MGAIFSRVKTWAAEKLTNEDLNAEIDNILDNFEPAQMDDYSSNVAQMQTTTDPGESGSESQATTLSGEIERLRHAIKESKGTTHWYETPSTTIEELSGVLGGGLPANRLISGASSANSSQALFLDPAISTNTLTLLGASTNFAYSIEGTQYTISSNVTATSLISAPTTNNTCLVNDTTLSGAVSSKYRGEYGTTIPYDTAGTEITGLDGKFAAFKIVNGSAETEYFVAYVDDTNNRLRECSRGFFFDGSQAPIERVTISNDETITVMKLTWVYANTSGTLQVGYTNPYVQADQPSSPSTGDYWFDTANDKWKTFNGATWPDADATLIGVCIQDENGNTVGARSFDFFQDHDAINTIQFSFRNVSNTTVRSTNLSNLTKVYGSSVRIQNGYIVWDIANDLESGQTEASNTTYYLYLKEDGGTVVSDIAPYDRRGDLLGWYHPHETWRCFASVDNGGGSNFSAVSLREINQSNGINEPFNGRYKLGSVQYFSSTGTWNRPEGCKAIKVECYGGGGGGGGAVARSTGATSGAGGGAGSYCEEFFFGTEFSIANETVTIGAAGSAGAGTGGNGGAGGSSSFGSLVVAGGGSGGLGSPSGATSDFLVGPGGAGGTPSSGTIGIIGGAGETAVALGSNNQTKPGRGGDAPGPFGGTGGRSSTISGGGGEAGDVPGGGGSGGGDTTANTNRAGGPGGAGFVVVYEYY